MEFKEIQEFEMQGGFLIKDNSSLQRTNEWLEQRKGRFTGSKIKDLMGCGRSTAQKPWGSIEKIYDFGATCERYIYKVGKERTTGVRDMDVSSQQMEYGKLNEPLLVQQLLKNGIISNFEEVPFLEFPNYSNGGASADGKAIFKGELVGLELKCTTSWDGHYNRMYEPVHDKHDDFWQFQSEMLALGVDKLLYVVAYPGTVEKYDYNIVNASPLHQKLILERCKIADAAIELWDEYSYKEALKIAIANYKSENQ